MSVYREHRQYGVRSDKKYGVQGDKIISIKHPLYGDWIALGRPRCIFCGYWTREGLRELIDHFAERHGRVV